MSRVVVLVMIAVGAVACGGGGDDSTAASDPPSQSASPSEDASSDASAESESGSESGSESSSASDDSASSSRTDAAADLSEFVCEPDADGEWSASGVITNSGGQEADYRVTVVVTDGPGASVPGKRRTLTELDPESPEPFDIKRLPADGATDATCQVEVLRLR
jgi:hypothetical protein